MQAGEGSAEYLQAKSDYENLERDLALTKDPNSAAFSMAQEMEQAVMAAKKRMDELAPKPDGIGLGIGLLHVNLEVLSLL